MAGVQFADVRFHPTEFLDLTSLTLEKFQSLVVPFEAAFQAHMAVWPLMGNPGPPAASPSIRIARCQRRKTGYSSCSFT